MSHPLSSSPSTLLTIAIFGLFGIFARYGAGFALARFQTALQFPIPTLTINLVGSFLIGAVYAFGPDRSWFSPEIRTALMVGLLGGFTTFSAFSLEMFTMIEDGRIATAILYGSLSPMLGVAFAYLGAGLCKTFSGTGI